MSEPNISVLKKVILSILFIVLLLFFTLTKLPQAKITALMQGYVQSALDPYGIYISDQGKEFSVWKGFQYTLTRPTLELPDQSRVELEEIVVSPKLLSLFTGKVGAEVVVAQQASKLILDGTARGDLIDATITMQDLDLNKFGVFSFIGALKGAGQIAGEIQVKGHLSDLPSLLGGVNLKLKRLQLDEQNLFGFQLPVIKINDGTIDATIEGGKLVMKNVQIGKGSDDLQIGVTGDVSINRNLNASNLNLRAVLGLSEKLKQSLSLLDSLMGAGKQADGKYVYKLTGPISSPMPLPDPKR